MVKQNVINPHVTITRHVQFHFRLQVPVEFSQEVSHLLSLFSVAYIFELKTKMQEICTFSFCFSNHKYCFEVLIFPKSIIQ